ncbi:MAG: hypothetical protein IT376_14240 [Polyangiaceae bacterium]|nr:hypothetical protein [Polyangiaceae bacterium]
MRPLVLAAALGLGALAPAPAWAQSAEPDPATAADARRFFDVAQKAFDEGRYVDAARAFEEAFRIKPHPFPLINAGDAWEKAGEYAMAARIFQRVLELEQSTDQDRTDAIERLARLKPQLGLIELKGKPSVKVKVGADEFHGGQRVYVFPGEHKVVLAEVDGAKPRVVEVAAGATVSVDVEKLDRAPASTESRPGEGGPARPPKAAPVEARGVGVGTWISFGIGGLGLGAAAVFGLQVTDAQSSFEERPNRGDYDRFEQAKLLTNVSLGVGVVGLGLGTYLLLGDLSSEPAADARRPPARGARVGVVPLEGGALVVTGSRF